MGDYIQVKGSIAKGHYPLIRDAASRCEGVI